MTRYFSLALLLLFSAGIAIQADEVKSGLQPGKFIGPFYVTKCAGATEDGVEVGKNLCYRCKYGGRPQVMVFTRSTGDSVVKLVSKLDAAVKKHSDKELSAFVSLLGDDKDRLSADAEKFAKTSKAKNVPMVVPNEFENGPENYGLNPKAEVTIIVAGAGKVEANHAFASADDVDVEAVLTAVNKVVN